MSTDKPRFTITVDPDLMQEIEDYRYNHRIKNQTQAVVSLMQRGLQEIIEKEFRQKPQEVEEYSPDELQLIADYREFSAEGKEKIREYAADLKDNPKYKKRDAPVLDKQA